MMLCILKLRIMKKKIGDCRLFIFNIGVDIEWCCVFLEVNVMYVIFIGLLIVDGIL